jgi:hypothetical protein
MDHNNEFFAQAVIMLASFCGGLVRLFIRPAETMKRSIFLLASCTICGQFGTPFILFEFPDWAPMQNGIAACVGLVGLSIATGILRAIDRFDFADLFSEFFGLIAKRFGK